MPNIKVSICNGSKILAKDEVDSRQTRQKQYAPRAKPGHKIPMVCDCVIKKLVKGVQGLHVAPAKAKLDKTDRWTMDKVIPMWCCASLALQNWPILLKL